jgi:hypothetical protein
MTFENMLKTFRDWLVTATGLVDAKVRMAQSNDVRPATPYATVQGLETTQNGWPEKSAVGDSGSTTVYGHRTTLVRVALFGSAGYDYLEKARLSTYRDDLYGTPLAAGLSVQGAGSIQNLSAPRGTDFEDRFVLDFSVGWVATVTDNVDGATIENIDSTATTVGGIVSDIDV